MNLAKFIFGKPSAVKEREKRHEAIARMIYGSRAQEHEKQVSSMMKLLERLRRR